MESKAPHCTVDQPLRLMQCEGALGDNLCNVLAQTL